MKMKTTCGQFINGLIKELANKQETIHKNPLCRSWKAQNQIFCFALACSILITFIIFLINYLFLINTILQLREISSEIFNKETFRQVSRYNDIQKRTTKKFFQESSDQLLKINSLYHHIQKGIQIQPPSDCLLNSTSNDTYAFNCVFCYAFCNSSNLTPNTESKYQYILQLTSLLTEYLSILNLQRYTYFTQKDDSQYFSLFNGSIDPTYFPHSRPWYKDHLNYMGNGTPSVVSSPYFAWLGTIFIAQTSNLTLLNNTFDGVVAQDADFNNLPKFMENDVLPIIVNQNGELIISKIYNQGMDEILRIDDTPITGFKSDDWELIQQTTVENSSTQFIFNSLFNQTILVSVIKLDFPQFYVVLFVDDSKYKKDEEDLFEKTVEFNYQYLKLILILFAGMFFVIVLLQSFVVKWLEDDLKYLTIMAKQKMFSSHFSFQHKLVISQKNSAITNLFRSYLTLIDNFTIVRREKNKICSLIEKQPFPKKQQLRLRIKKLFKSINDPIQEFNIEWLIQIIQQFHEKDQFIS